MFDELKGLQVLVIEDEPCQAIAFEDALTDAGAVVVGPFSSLSAAKMAIEGGAVQVAIVDYSLGSETAAGLQEALESRGVPYVVITGYPRTLVRRHAQQIIYRKPLSNIMLFRIVAAMARELSDSRQPGRTKSGTFYGH